MARPKKLADIANVADLDNAKAVAEANKPAASIPKPEGSLVSVTITKFGEGKVSTGIHVAGEGDIYASRGEKLMVAADVAEKLEVLGVAEIDVAEID